MSQVLLPDLRAERGRAIASKKNAIKKVKPNLYVVQSQSGVGSYRVTVDDEAPACSCPDAISRGPEDFRTRPCKHYLGVRFYLTAERDTPHGTITERVLITRGQAWSAYNTAQASEIQLFDSLLRDLVNGIEEPPQTIGRPRIPLRDAIFCTVQKVYSQLSCRRARGLFENAAGRDQLDRAPHFNLTSKALNRADLTPVLHALIARSAQPMAALEDTWAIDSTGFRTTSFGAYHAGKYGAVKPHIWLKAHLSVGTRTHVVSQVIVTDSQGEGTLDTAQFPALLRGTVDAGFRVSHVLADKAYSSRVNHDAADAAGAIPFIPFRENASGRSFSAPMWKKAYHYFQLHREEFDARYHKRSNVESAIAAIKRKLGETLKSKNRVAQENELLCKVLAYNVTVLIHEMHENGVDPALLTSRSPQAGQGH